MCMKLLEVAGRAETHFCICVGRAR
uniref:Uncharacterized protein n=1 Tax=Rhizophora mucronata TaxID=61149 RepID=A0A2P2QC19_RHIMU